MQQEKDDLQIKFEEDKGKIHKEKEQLLTKQVGVKEVVHKALHSVTSLEQMEEDRIKWRILLNPFSSVNKE